jgi:hypothetical protein
MSRNVKLRVPIGQAHQTLTRLSSLKSAGRNTLGISGQRGALCAGDGVRHRRGLESLSLRELPERLRRPRSGARYRR